MNIKKRIESLEQHRPVSGFCLCYGSKILFETFGQEVDKNGKEGNLKPFTEVYPDICDGCGLEVNKQTVIVQFIEPNIPIPSGARV